MQGNLGQHQGQNAKVMRIQPTPPNVVIGGFIRDGARWMPIDKECSTILDVDLYI
jgi:hypothetical protein